MMARPSNCRVWAAAVAAPTNAAASDMVVRRAPLLLLLTACTSADAWTVFADTREPPDLTNVTTAMASAYRWSMRRPFMKWALSPDFCGAMHPLLIEEKSSTMFLTERWQNFTRCAPEIERLFESVARSCMAPGSSGPLAQAAVEAES